MFRLLLVTAVAASALVAASFIPPNSLYSPVAEAQKGSGWAKKIYKENRKKGSPKQTTKSKKQP
jgi:hypothetical protein